MTIGLDVGTSTLKRAKLDDQGHVVSTRLQPTPTTPSEILLAVGGLAADLDDIIGVSLFRRAAVVPEDDRILFARDAPTPDRTLVAQLSESAIQATSVSDPLAVVHRWYGLDQEIRRSRVDILDSWLSEKLTGRRVISECAAWLTGLWRTDTGGWDPEVAELFAIEIDALPEVLTSPAVESQFVLPFLGDHQATAAGWASTRNDYLCVLELGTALAVLTGEPSTSSPIALALATPRAAGYSELIDPFFARRCQGEDHPAPTWLPDHSRTSALGVLQQAAEIAIGDSDADCFVEGGNASTELLEGVGALQGRMVRAAAVSAPAGALLFADETIQMKGREDEV